MAETINLVSNYGIMIVIVGLFLWDWVDNRKSIKQSLKEMSISNSNISKSLELLQKNMESQEHNLVETDERIKTILEIVQKILVIVENLKKS